MLPVCNIDNEKVKQVELEILIMNIKIKREM